MCQVGVNRTCAVAQQRCKMMHLSRLPALQDHGDRRPLLCAHQVLLESGHCQKRRDRHMVLIHIPVCQDQDVGSLADHSVDLDEQVFDRFLKTCILIVCDRDLSDLEPVHIHILDLQKVCVRQDRIVHPEHLTVLFLLLKKVSVFPDIDRGRCHDLLTDRVDRRIRNLREQLLKISEQRLAFSRENRKRYVDSHRGDSLSAVLCHRKDRGLDVLICVSERFLEAGALLSCIFRDILVRDLEILQLDQVPVKPLAVRFLIRIFFFQLFIVDHPSSDRVDEQHLAWMQPLLHKDLGRIDVEHTNLRGKDQVVVIRDIVSGRPQPVAVEHCPHHVSVREKDGRRTVPGLHHCRVILIEILLVLGHAAVVHPRLRDRDHDGKRKLHAAHHHKFQRVVQHRRVRSRRVDRREHLVQLSLEAARLHGLLTGAHLVRISTDRIDLAVVHDKTVRMGSLPARGSVGAEPGMHHGDR